MKYYAHINSKNKLTEIDLAQVILDEYDSSNVQNIEVTEQIYNNSRQYGINYYIYQNGNIVQNPNYEQEQLAKAKEDKYEEANEGAKSFLNTTAAFEFAPNYHVEATKENMNSFASAAMAIEKGLIPYQEWTSKEDNVRQLDEEECLMISMGIGQIQSSVWNVQFIAYKNAISSASTVAEVEQITINYGV